MSFILEAQGFKYWDTTALILQVYPGDLQEQVLW